MSILPSPQPDAAPCPGCPHPIADHRVVFACTVAGCPCTTEPDDMPAVRAAVRVPGPDDVDYLDPASTAYCTTCGDPIADGRCGCPGRVWVDSPFGPVDRHVTGQTDDEPAGRHVTDVPPVPPAVAEYAVMRTADGDVTLTATVQPAADAATVPGVLDGFVCLFCGADLTVPGVVSVPAGVVDGCQVFACQAHAAEVAR
ncbi:MULTISPECIES: hypothetical protein [Protofrankia]|uniref:Uncharacterized protein n=1 Tax=Protofrankia coriariae TaxID=1562887 RepID=A0ABR5F294_9ACTN|nr:MULTISPECIES: hypothetical protein [Protofrankia]KLL10819.1 hypothetical protein FrCorBMG51_15490 [Protofrankia coriariae]ONH34021.1 hypothetical protein BL254_18455 [Protofrankia sp. BMG5.30]